MLIATRFDGNRDGVLTEAERQECLEALRNNMEGQKRFLDDYPLAEALHHGKLKHVEDTRDFSVSAL